MTTKSNVNMRQKLKMPLVAVCLCLAGAGTANAQWVVSDPTNLAQSIMVSDPTNLAQSIINSAKEMVETAGTKANTLNGFLETKKVFEQGKKYYDALKSVHDVVKGGVKVSKSISLVMEISEIYVDNYQKMLSDENYSPEELAIDESSDVLQDLKNVVNVTGMSLSDAERLAIIDNAYRSLMNYRNLVRYYTNKTISVSYLRARKKNDMDRVMGLYGNPNERYW